MKDANIVYFGACVALGFYSSKYEWSLGVTLAVYALLSIVFLLFT